ncbi:MAG: DUF4389 domain-containing protein [Gammaproteobacteria bacterium]|nr:DUF4389 domain-containing protein [Gammaproteobacteria bacterium]MDP2139234.1 DUF4389 domain-containing protein [Gammaproteobacteria bacterium]MDP2348997.1 DUF4389 domain-containing protein [Gammaproteobacteria bacterium]
MSDDIVENLKQPSQWFRVAFMVVFAVVLYVVALILTLLTVAQIFFSLLTGSDNENLRGLGKDLTIYVNQILAFLTYNSDEKPFPFAVYPASGDVTQPVSEAHSNADIDVKVHVQEGADTTAAKRARSAPRKPATKKRMPPVSEAGEEV